MTTEYLPIAPEAYERANEARMRSILEERLDTVETAIYEMRTTLGTISLGQGDVTLANGANNNVGAGYYTFARISGPTAAFSTTGFYGGERGRLLLLRNTTAQDWTISNESASSDAANRIITGTGADVTLTGVSAAVLLYDATEQRWILFATQG